MAVIARLKPSRYESPPSRDESPPSRDESPPSRDHEELLDTRAAFDGVARTYDESNAANRTLCEMRVRTLDRLRALVPGGARVLDLGCGPGCDTEILARAGYRVTAVDWSSEMVSETRRRIHGAGLADRVDVHNLGIQELEALPAASFDAAVSDLGPLNCVPDLRAAGQLIADRLRPGGTLVASVIGRVCPWEIALFASRGDWARVRVRFARQRIAVPLAGRTVWTRYYAADEFAKALSPAGFTRVSHRSLGLFVPPPYMQAFADRHPRLISRLQTIEDLVSGWPVLRGWGDHFLMVLRKA